MAYQGRWFTIPAHVWEPILMWCLPPAQPLIYMYFFLGAADDYLLAEIGIHCI